MITGGRQISVLIASWLVLLLCPACRLSPEQRAGRHLERGKQLMQTGDHRRAVLEFRNAAQGRPGDPEVLYQLAAAELAAGEYAEAVSLLKTVVEANPQHTQAQSKLAEVLAGTNSAELVGEARKRAESLVAAGKGGSEPLTTLALAELKLGEGDSAADHLGAALALAPQNVRAWLLLAAARFARDDTRGVEDALSQAAKHAPGSVPAHVALGNFYAMTARDEPAEVEFRKALAADASSAAALFSLAALSLRRHGYDSAGDLYRRISQLPDKKLRSTYAIFLQQTGRTDEALRELERLWREDPADRTVRSRLVALVMHRRGYEAALRLLEQALKYNSKDTDALIQRAELLTRIGRLDEAERDIAQVVAAHPESAEPRLVLGHIFQARGDLRRARQELGSALERNPVSTTARIELSRLHLLLREPDTALKVIEDTPEPLRKTLPVLIQRNWALLARNRITEAEQNVNTGLAAGSVPELLLQRAFIQMSKKQISQARESLNQVLNQNPEELRAFDMLTRSYDRDPAGAAEALKAHALRAPGSAPVQHSYGRVLLKAGRNTDARKIWESVVTSNPAFLPAKLSLAELDATEGNLPAARERLTNIVASSRFSPAWFLLGNIEEQTGNYAAAVTAYRKVLDSDPDNVLALNNLAFVLAEYSRDPNAALPFAQEAKRIAPDVPFVDDTIGWVYYRLGNYRQAVQYFERAAKEQSAVRERVHLGIALLRLGERERGIATLKPALATSAHWPEVQLARQLLAEAK